MRSVLGSSNPDDGTIWHGVAIDLLEAAGCSGSCDNLARIARLGFSVAQRECLCHRHLQRTTTSILHVRSIQPNVGPTAPTAYHFAMQSECVQWARKQEPESILCPVYEVRIKEPSTPSTPFDGPLAPPTPVLTRVACRDRARFASLGLFAFREAGIKKYQEKKIHQRRERVQRTDRRPAGLCNGLF